MEIIQIKGLLKDACSLVTVSVLFVRVTSELLPTKCSSSLLREKALRRFWAKLGSSLNACSKFCISRICVEARSGRWFFDILAGDDFAIALWWTSMPIARAFIFEAFDNNDRLLLLRKKLDMRNCSSLDATNLFHPSPARTRSAYSPLCYCWYQMLYSSWQPGQIHWAQDPHWSHLPTKTVDEWYN